MDYTSIPSDEIITATAQALRERNIESIAVPDRMAALEKIKELIPAGASVMNGASRTLEEIGYIDYLKSGAHGWNNLHAGILAEKDPVKQAALRKQAVLSDYYLGSVHALVQNGEFIIASNSGSQLPHVVYTSPNLIFVVSAMKIVQTFEEAMKRLEEHVIPLEDARMIKAANVHTNPSKVLRFSYEQPFGGRKVRMILIKEKLGF